MPEAISTITFAPRRRAGDGSLHEVTALALATGRSALKERNSLPKMCVDDVILGVVDPVARPLRHRPLCGIKAGLGEPSPGVQISRFCAPASMP